MKHFIFILLSLTLLILFPFCLMAQEETTLGEVVVTGTRDTEEIRKIPANVTVITRESIEKSNAQTTVDLLRGEADVVVQDYFGNGKSASVDMRGFGETGPLNTLVLVDGRRVNEIDLSGVDWTQIPLDQIERIEIVRGSGSVLYGDNAAGGVINIITKMPEKPFSAQAEAVWGSYGYYKGAASAGGKWGPLSALFSASYQNNDGYRVNGFLRAKDVGGKLVYDLSEDFQFNLSAGFHQDYQGLPGGLPQAIYDVNRQATTAPDDGAGTDDWYLALGAKAKFGEWGRFEMNLSYRDREVGDLWKSEDYADKRDLTTWGVAPRYILEKALWVLPNKLTAGLDFYYSDSRVFSESNYGSATGSLVEVTRQSTGLYVLDELSLLKNLILSMGYREEWVAYDISQDIPKGTGRMTGNEPAFNAALDYLFGKKSSAFLSIKRSFRFPVSDELIEYFPVFQVNPLIKPQTGYHYEAGVRHAFTDWIEANMTLFWVDMTNEIFFNPYTYTNTNFPKTRRQGIEIGTKVKPLQQIALFDAMPRLRNLTLWGNYTYLKPTLRADSLSGNEIPGVPRHKGSVGADIEIWKGLSFNTRANFVGSRYAISDWENKADKWSSYYSMDARLSYTWKGLKAFIGVNNVTNQKYSEYVVVNAAGAPFFYPSPERNFIGGLSYTF